jgi:hypothetical protein
MNLFDPKRHAFALVLLLSLNSVSFAADVIYKCSSPSGAVTFSAKPCIGSTQVKKIEPRTVVVGAEPVLPGNIPGRRGQISPEPPVDTTPRRTPMPQVIESCRSELFNLKRSLDSRFIAAEQNLKNSRAAMAQNTRELESAQTSKVGLEWGLMLAEQRRVIEQRLKDADAELALFYPDEKAQFEEIGKRCRKN